MTSKLQEKPSVQTLREKIQIPALHFALLDLDLGTQLNPDLTEYGSNPDPLH